MSQILKIQDAGSKWRESIESLREKNEEYIIKDEQDQPVAVVLPMECYEIYQRQRKQDFAILDKIAEDLKDYDPDFIEAQIETAVAEVKAMSKAKRQRT